MSQAIARSLLTTTLAALSCAAPQPSPSPRAAAATPPVPSSKPTAQVPPAFESRGGMWLPAQVPLHDQELKRLGLGMDSRLLSDPKSSVLGAIVNLNGCSASFVSKDGLVVTNHHCALGALQRNSTPESNLLENGMLAKTRAEEKSSGPASRLSVLSSMTEVTARVRPELAKITDDLARKLELERLEKQIVAE
ncbi:MAG TPA: S46 family peptidase, partial [Polyangiaceae bacterium]|nr:S46 family peptidase [Polyangiaceae bacterium]